jgi:AcrR family transcriptional regulator
VFSVKGFSKATMEDIAKEAELSPGTLYLYFKNKDELYASLSLRILQYLLIRLEHVNAEPDLSPDQMIESLKETMYDVYEFDPLILINMFHLQSSEALKNLTPELLSEIRDLSQNSLNAMAKIFEKGINRGTFVDKKPMVFSDIVWSLFSGIVLWEESKRILNEESTSLKETLEIAFEIFAQGIKKRKGGES